MRKPARAGWTALVILAASSVGERVDADGLEPASVLVYPIHRSGPAVYNVPPSQQAVQNGPFMTVVAVTNTNLKPATPLNGLGGTTNAHFEFVNTVENPQTPLVPFQCDVMDLTFSLTPGDTMSMVTSCPNPVGQQGYLVVSAQDPNAFKRPWSHNYLVGSEIVLFPGLAYTLNAIPFEAIGPDGAGTDLDLDGQLDFDGLEYEPAPDEMYLSPLIPDLLLDSIVLINLSGGTPFRARVALDIFNDNERPLSATITFRCWAEEFLADVSQAFTPGFLRANTIHDPREADFDCDGSGEYETAWAVVRGLTASSSVESFNDPAVLVAHTRLVVNAGGRRAFESEEKQADGDFLKTGTDDPEFP